MTLKSYAQFEEKLTCGLENDMKNLANFLQSTWKCKNWGFCPKQKIHELKVYKGVMCNDTEE